MAARLNKNQQILIKKSSCTNIMKSMWVVLKSPWWTQRHEGVFAKTCVIGGLYVCVIGGLYVELNDLQAAVHICSSSTSWEATATFICLSLSYRMQCCVDCCDDSRKRTAAAFEVRAALAPYTAIECPGPPWFSPGLCEPLIIVSHIEPLIFVFILQPLLFVLTMYPFNFNGQAMHLFWYRTTLLPGLNLGLWSVGLWSVGL